MLAFALIASVQMKAGAQQDLTFLSPDGQAVPLSSMSGKVVALVFSGAQDPQCRDEFKALQSLIERYQGKEVSFFWVSINSPNEMSNEKLKAPCGPPLLVPTLRDQGAFRRFGGRQLPTLVILDQQGRIYGQPHGGFNPNSDFINDIAAIIDGLLIRK